jgi:hypothetical protein
VARAANLGKHALARLRETQRGHSAILPREALPALCHLSQRRLDPARLGFRLFRTPEGRRRGDPIKTPRNSRVLRARVLPTQPRSASPGGLPPNDPDAVPPADPRLLNPPISVRPWHLDLRPFGIAQSTGKTQPGSPVVTGRLLSKRSPAPASAEAVRASGFGFNLIKTSYTVGTKL